MLRYSQQCPSSLASLEIPAVEVAKSFGARHCEKLFMTLIPQAKSAVWKLLLNSL